MKIKFNKKIYSKKALNRAMDDFKDLMDCNLKEVDGYYVINANYKKDYDNLEEEFSNYVLALMK